MKHFKKVTNAAFALLMVSFSTLLICSGTMAGEKEMSTNKKAVSAAVPSVLKDFYKYDWTVAVDPKSSKASDEYDVIIIGSGLGGLSCGTMLAKRGYKVLILEHHYRVGGCSGSFKRKGFIFNNGAGEITGLWDTGPITQLMKEAGLNRDDYFVQHPAATQYITGGERVPELHPDELSAMLSDMFPDEKDNIKAYFDDMGKAFNEFYNPVQTYGTVLAPELYEKALGLKQANYRADYPHAYDWLTHTLAKKFNDHFSNKELLAVMNDIFNFHKTDLEITPAISVLRSYGYMQYGAWFPKGGGQRFVNALRRFIESNGGEVLCKHKVDSILTEKGAVKGVKVGKKIFKSPIVVSNANAKLTYLDLVDRSALAPEFVAHIESLKMAYSVFMVFLGVDMDISKYPSVINNTDEGYVVYFASNSDPSYAPEGKANIVLIRMADYDKFPDRKSKDYKKVKKAAADALIKKVENLIPGLSQHIVVRDAATPKTIERYILAPRGTAEGFDDTIDNVHPCFKSPIKGLYQVGASVFPGSGVENALMSGTMAANDIYNWKIK